MFFFPPPMQALVDRYAEELVEPILSNVNDTNTRIRLAVFDQLANVVKVLRDGNVRLFRPLFLVLAEHVAELDNDVKASVELVDRALKDAAVGGHPGFSAAAFVDALKERAQAADDPFARMYLLGWVVQLETWRNTSLVPYLPLFLDAIFRYLADPNRDVYST